VKSGYFEDEIKAKITLKKILIGFGICDTPIFRILMIIMVLFFRIRLYLSSLIKNTEKSILKDISALD